MAKGKVWFMHGRPGPHPLHKKYGEATGGQAIFVDYIWQWHIKKQSIITRYLAWLVNSVFFAVRVKHEDVILTEGVHITAILTKWMARFLGKKIHTTVLMDNEFLYFLENGHYKAFSEKLNRYFVRKYDHVFCIGEMQYRLAIKIIGDEGKLSRGFNGVADERLEQLLKIVPDLESKNIVFIGNGPNGWRAFYKGLDLVFQAFEQLVVEFPESKLFIIGEWDASVIQELKDQYCPNAGEKIILVGQTNNLGQYLSQATLYLHPGRGEAWGISINEAMAAGIAPIVSEWTGASESVRKVSPELVTSLHKERISEKVNAYFRQPVQERRRMSVLAKQVASEYSEKAAIARFSYIFKKWYENE